MPEIVMRLGILVLVAIAVWLGVSLCRRFIESQRQKALKATPLFTRPDLSESTNVTSEHAETRVPAKILAFSSIDCRQCHQLQTPALSRVLEARGDIVSVVNVDATTEKELVQTYHILTVPSTVVIDATGQARAINYGFANTQLLLSQIDALLAL